MSDEKAEDLRKKLINILISQHTSSTASSSAASPFTSSSTASSTATAATGSTAGGAFVPDSSTPPKNAAAPSPDTSSADDYLRTAFANLQAKTEGLTRRANSLKLSEQKITALIAESETKVEDIELRLSRADEILAGLNATQTKLLDEVQLIRGNAVSALSIFVSFFAFITVSINVFSKAGSLAVGALLILLFWSMLVGFNVLIGWQFNTIKNNAMALVVLVFVATLSVVCLFFMYHWAPESITAPKIILEPSK